MIWGEISLWSVKVASGSRKNPNPHETYPNSWSQLLMCLNFSILHRVVILFHLHQHISICFFCHLLLKNLNYPRPGFSFLFCVCSVPGITRSQSIKSTFEVRILKQLLIQINPLYLILSFSFFFLHILLKPAPNLSPWEEKVCYIAFDIPEEGRQIYQVLATSVTLCSWPFSIDVTDTVAANIGSGLNQNLLLYSLALKNWVGKGIMMSICASFMANPFLHVYPYPLKILKLAWQQFKAFQLRGEQCRWMFSFSIHVMQKQRFSCFWPAC